MRQKHLQRLQQDSLLQREEEARTAETRWVGSHRGVKAKFILKRLRSRSQNRHVLYRTLKQDCCRGELLIGDEITFQNKGLLFARKTRSFRLICNNKKPPAE